MALPARQEEATAPDVQAQAGNAKHLVQKVLQEIHPSVDTSHSYRPDTTSHHARWAASTQIHEQMRQHQPCHQTNPIDHVHVWHCCQKACANSVVVVDALWQARLWARAAHSVVVAEALWQAQLSACPNSVVAEALWQARLWPPLPPGLPLLLLVPAVGNEQAPLSARPASAPAAVVEPAKDRHPLAAPAAEMAALAAQAAPTATFRTVVASLTQTPHCW